jgi:hypothetical protein
MPTGKQNIQGAYWNGKIYVPGGFAASVHITENAIYDIATNTWSTGAPLPAPQTGTTVAFNNKIYNFGGNPGPQTTTTIYDIATNTWSTGASMPVATTYGRAVVAGNYAYYVGGIAGVTTNAVIPVRLCSEQLGNDGTAADGQDKRRADGIAGCSKLYAVMGGDATFFTGVPLAQSVEIYDVATNTWTYGLTVTQKAAAPSGGLAGGKLMVQGGVDGTTYFNTVQVSTLTGGVCGTPTSTATATATATGTPATATPTATVACTPGTYTTTTGTGTITGGGTDIGNHCDDCFTQISLPFPVNAYGTSTSVAFAGSNGDLQLTATPGDKCSTGSSACRITPDQGMGGPYLNTLFPYYDDLRTDEVGTCPDCGIFTQTLGSAPNRQFVVRYKTTYFNIPGGTAEFEVLLTEGSDTLSVIYGASADEGTTAASGIQQDVNQFTSFSCFAGSLTPSLRVDYAPAGCGTPSATPTSSATATATPTTTASSTATPTGTVSQTATPTNTPTPSSTATPTGICVCDGYAYYTPTATTTATATPTATGRQAWHRCNLLQPFITGTNHRMSR